MARVTVEDCLEKIPSRFALSLIAAKRTRLLLKGNDALLKSHNKEAVVALREIASGKVGMDDASTEMLEELYDETYNK